MKRDVAAKDNSRFRTRNVHDIPSNHHHHRLHRTVKNLEVTCIMDVSLSLEETNKIRVSVGLEPLTEGDGTPAADDKDAQAEDNYVKWREAEAKEKERKYVC